MEIMAIVAVTGLLNIFCFMVGARVGQAVTKGETIESPVKNPLKAVAEHRERKEAEMEQNRVDTIMRNIESYDGTAKGQEDVPGRV